MIEKVKEWKTNESLGRKMYAEHFSSVQSRNWHYDFIALKLRLIHKDIFITLVSS